MCVHGFLQGSVDVRITTAAPEALLHAANAAGVCLRNVLCIDDLTISMNVGSKDYRILCNLAEKYGAKIHIIRKKGLYWGAVGLVYRPVFMLGLMTIFLLTVLLPTHILFVEISGNETLPDALILEKASLCGIKFGASRRHVRSEATKNQLLSILPELRWAGVNTRGCVAVISVQEKPVTQPRTEHKGVCHIVAEKDGIISTMTILRGVPLCKAGQAVTRGQVLVSGYIDHGLSLEGTSADAEITGYTGNILYMLTPMKRTVRTNLVRANKRYSVLVGKKLINFGKDSGISDSECVRMYEERYLTLPGGFRLPIALVKERIFSYSLATQVLDNADDYAWVGSAAKDYLYSQMLSGEILRSNSSAEIGDGVYIHYGAYQCREIIGRTHSEEKMTTDEQRS